jgi:3' terminal RNA ribose 2'-O-methyltransferase Hen1
MLLTITCQGRDADKLGFLLHKHPDRFQTIPLSYGRCHVFYPQATDKLVTACLMLDIDTVALTKNKRNRRSTFALAGYVNDRPYVASSFLSVAISNAFGTAMASTCKKFPAAPAIEFDVEVSIDVLPSRGGTKMINRIFEPLGYQVTASEIQLDHQFPEWGSSCYSSVVLTGHVTIARLLQHLYVLVPVFDNQKHYFIDQAELDKLLAKGKDWLEGHPEKEWIVSRYLKYDRSLANQALASLTENRFESETDAAVETEASPTSSSPPDAGKQIRLNDQRLDAVEQQLDACGASSVIDLGCGEGKLLRRLLKKWQFREIVGVDVCVASLEIAAKRLRLRELPAFQSERVKLLHGSLMYRDRRFDGFDAAAVVEVIEHLDPPRLSAFEQVVFKHARPNTIVLTTPNSDYNVMWPSLPAGKFRHPDHRFEWSRNEFRTWAQHIADTYGYTFEILPVGEEDPSVGSPTQMAVFRIAAEPAP